MDDAKRTSLWDRMNHNGLPENEALELRADHEAKAAELAALKAQSAGAPPAAPRMDGDKVLMTLGTLRVLADGTTQEHWGPPGAGEWHSLLDFYSPASAERQRAEQLSDFGRELAKALQASWDMQLQQATLKAQRDTAHEEVAALKADNAALLKRLRDLTEAAHPWGMHVLGVVDFSHMRSRPTDAIAGTLGLNTDLTMRQFVAFADAFYEAGEVFRDLQPHPGAALLKRTGALAGLADAFAAEAENAVKHYETKGQGGMQVPYGGDFSNVPPSVVIRLRWWAKAFREALAGETGSVAALREENERVRQQSNLQDSTWQERMANTLKSQHELRQRAEAAERARAAAVSNANDLERGLTKARERIIELEGALATEETESTRCRDGWARERIRSDDAAQALARANEQVERLAKLDAETQQAHAYCDANRIPPGTLSERVKWARMGPPDEALGGESDVVVSLDSEDVRRLAAKALPAIESKAAGLEAAQARANEQVEHLGALVQQAVAEKQEARDAALSAAAQSVEDLAAQVRAGSMAAIPVLMVAKERILALKSSPARFVPEEKVRRVLTELAEENEAKADAQHGRSKRAHDEHESMGGVLRHALRRLGMSAHEG